MQRKISFSTNLTNNSLTVSLQENEDTYNIIPNFELNDAEMEIWRKQRNASSSSSKAELRAQHLQRCLDNQILPPWSLSAQPWNFELSDNEKQDFVKLEKEMAKKRLDILIRWTTCTSSACQQGKGSYIFHQLRLGSEMERHPCR